MSEARERLIEAGADDLWEKDDPIGRDVSVGFLDSFLSRPDDLLAVLVEEGVMEQVGWQDEAGYLHYDRRSMVGAVVPVYIRTEGNTR